MGGSTTFHEDVFYEYFRPLRHPSAAFDIWGGHGLEAFGTDLEIVCGYDRDFVWTVLDAENSQWIVSGFHYVNRVCHLLTEVPHNGAPLEFRVDPPWNALTSLGLHRRIATLRRMLENPS